MRLINPNHELRLEYKEFADRATKALQDFKDQWNDKKDEAEPTFMIMLINIELYINQLQDWASGNIELTPQQIETCEEAIQEMSYELYLMDQEMRFGIPKENE